MYTKEQIIEEIQRVAKKLGTKMLKKKDFEKNSMIPMHTLSYYLGSWSDAVKEAGLEDLDLKEGGSEEEDVGEDELMLDLIRLYEEYKKDPTLELVTIEGKFDTQLYEKKWKNIENAFLKAKKKFPEKFIDKGKNEYKEVSEVHESEVVSESEEEVELEKEQTGDEEPINFGDLNFEEIEVDEKTKEGEEKDVDEGEKPEDMKLDPTIPQGSSEYEKVSFDQIDLNEETQEQQLKDIPDISKPADKIEEPMEDSEEPIELTNEEISDETLNKEMEDIPQKEEIEDIKKRPTASEEDINFVEAKVDQNVNSDYIYDQREKLTPSTIKPITGKKKRKVVGELIDFRGVRFAPLNRIGVAYLFGMISHELDFIIESFRREYPDCEGRRCFDKEKNQWEYVRITFEYKSSDFKEKGYDQNECDILVCWVHDWEECPLEVMELRSTILSDK